MTAASFAHLPMQVGSVAMAHSGRAALWVIQRYMRSPLTNSAIAALVVTTAMAGSNALYGQTHDHPSPMFSPSVAVAKVEPVIPATKPEGLGTQSVASVAEEPVTRPAAVSTASTNGPSGNPQVYELQQKLETMKLFSGTMDGYYGPQTASAIRKFEELNGLKPVGKLTPDIVQRIMGAPSGAAAPVSAMQVVEEPKPAAAVTLPAVEAPRTELNLPVAKPLAATEAPVKPQTLALAQPAPLSDAISTGSTGRQAATVASRPMPDSPEEAMEMAVETAGDALDTIVTGVQSMAMTRPGKPETVAKVEAPRVGVPLAIEEEPPKPGTAVAVLDTPATPAELAPVSTTDPVFVAKVQRGLASLGFLHGPADGVAGEATAKAIRNFEVYFRYEVTGRITPDLVDLLVENGAVI